MPLGISAFAQSPSTYHPVADQTVGAMKRFSSTACTPGAWLTAPRMARFSAQERTAPDSVTVLSTTSTFIRFARVTWAGEFRIRRADDRWNPFKATQYFSTQPPGFVWDASMRMAHLMSVRVRDAYLAGEGSMQTKILSLVPVVDERGKAELNAGALQRYLAEAVWFPTALLPSAGVQWGAVDDSRALATLTDSGTTVSLEFRFNEAGEITSVFTPGRYRAVNGKYGLARWEAHLRSY